MKENILVESKKMQEQLVKWRRDLHRIPELGIRLPKTVAYISEELNRMGINYEIYEDCSCIVAQIGNGGKCFMLRADMDGLPIVEKADVDFASVNGCMHGCGHDMHATALLGAAKLLKAHESELKGTVKLLFQSGEETFQGAKAALEAGVLENPHVDAAFAMHVFAAVPMGTMMYGTLTSASVYGFKIILTGKGGHGAHPENSIDPINAGTAVYGALQSLIARECASKDEVVLTIGQFAAGEVANVIPEKCVLQGTLRTFDNQITKKMVERIHEMAASIASTYRCTLEIEELSNVPVVKCDESLNEEIIESIKSLDENMKCNGGVHSTGSEDFAVFSEKIPVSYFAIGAGVEDKEKRLSQHNPRVVFNEECLHQSSAIYAKTAMDWLEKH